MPETTDTLIQTLQEWVETFMRHSMHRFFLFIKENDLSMSQMGALMNIHRLGVCSVSDIGDELGVTSAAASQMLERLVQQGLIERTEDPGDRRAKQIVLTEKGRQMIRKSFDARQAWLGELAANFTPAEREQAHAALRLLLEKTKELGGEVDGRQ